VCDLIGCRYVGVVLSSARQLWLITCEEESKERKSLRLVSMATIGGCVEATPLSHLSMMLVLDEVGALVLYSGLVKVQTTLHTTCSIPFHAGPHSTCSIPFHVQYPIPRVVSRSTCSIPFHVQYPIPRAVPIPHAVILRAVPHSTCSTPFLSHSMYSTCSTPFHMQYPIPHAVPHSTCSTPFHVTVS
jgi:hypothetical protein